MYLIKKQMIKFYKNFTEYADEKDICTKTASKRIKNWLVEVFEVPKGMKYYEIDKQEIIDGHYKSLYNNK